MGSARASMSGIGKSADSHAFLLCSNWFYFTCGIGNLLHLYFHTFVERTQIEETVKQLLTDDLGKDAAKIYPKAHLIDDIGIDYLDFIDVMFIIQQAFGIRIKAKEIAELKTFEQLCDYIDKETNK